MKTVAALLVALFVFLAALYAGGNTNSSPLPVIVLIIGLIAMSLPLSAAVPHRAEVEILPEQPPE